MTRSERVFFLGDESEEREFGALELQRLSSGRDVEEELARLEGRESVLWIARGAEEVGWLVRALVGAKGKRRRDQLLVLEPLQVPELVNVVHALFARVVPGFNLLPREQMAEVLQLEERANYCVGGMVDPNTETVTLFRGDLSTLVVPFSCFEASPTGIEPDFGRFAIGDWGQTLVFGEFEASVAAVLYELDGEYRRP